MFKSESLTHGLGKTHPIYVNWVPLYTMKTPGRYTKICEKAPEKAGTLYTFYVNMRTPSGTIEDKVLHCS